METMMTVLFIALALGMAQADPPRNREQQNYILRRQQAYAVQGTPTQRLIIGRREIDVYRAPGGGHVMFERDHMVGATR
jgi:hypothetical protein